jgi:hypothetical protein
LRKERGEFILSARFCFIGIIGLLKAEKVAKIGAGFVEYSFGLCFVAIIVDALLVKNAIPAAMKVGAAKRTLLLPADKFICFNFLSAFMANFHIEKVTEDSTNCQEIMENTIFGIKRQCGNSHQSLQGKHSTIPESRKKIKI